MSDDWTGSYRLQLHSGFPLAAAERALPYLARLGVSHVYLSPCLQAAPGSQHGYDVVDPTRVSDELGGESAWTSFVAAAKAQNLRILLDIVPNHMAATEQNPWWNDLLANGPYSRYADYFDVRPAVFGPWRVHLPILAEAYGRVLESRKLQIELVGGFPRVRHYDDSWPLGCAAWGILLGGDLRHADCFVALEALVSIGVPETGDREAYAEHVQAAGEFLREAHERGAVRTAVERVNSDPDALDALLRRQFYALHYWKLAGEVTNYRRFFDVAGLVGVRCELPQVFAAGHRRILAMIENGDIDALRVDHPDGLKDPLEYFGRLKAALPRSGRIYAEKILGNDERLPEDWPIDGTVGYEFLAKVNRLWMDDRCIDALTGIYSDFTGHSINFTSLVREKKRNIVESTFFADLERLTEMASEIAQRRWATADLSKRQLREALARITTALPVYRTYRTAATQHAACRRLLTEAVQSAAMTSADIEPAVFAFLGELLVKETLDESETRLVAAWQQLSPAVMAKGVEDTTFYCFDRLVACNEVGAQASLIGISANKFHEFCHYLAEHWPRNLLATSTHDNKRSEDVRTRISVLTEIPERWGEILHQWSQLNAPLWQNRTPDRHAEYLLYQTMIGAWPIDRDRCWQYMLKACREAKIATSWHEPNPGYEKTIQEFIDGLFDSREFIVSLERFVEPLILPGRINSLAQCLIKMTAPGVPDFYQGTESWDLSLVDPDNRRPVDFARHARMLDECRDFEAHEVVRDWNSGLPKLWMIARTLRLKVELPQPFHPNSRYQPLVAQGANLGRLLAYQRGDDLIAVVPRFTLSLNSGWEDTSMNLPEGRWRNCFTGAELSGTVTPDRLFGAFPVALLARVAT
jgi:(1->4)-alpha-D-glucan 1-alpha-D-glucosylmutase